MTEAWGTGRPDFYSDVITSRSVVVEQSNTQIAWQIYKAYAINAQSAVIDTIYTVPAGYNLTIDTGLICVKDSCINKIQIVASNSIIGDYRFDVRGDITTAIAGQILPPDAVLVAYIYNNDAIASDFSLVLTGFLSVVKT